MLLPTMTLEELHQTVYFDLEFILRKLDESVKNFGKLSLKRNRYPFAKKYTWKNYKSNISYNFYIKCFKRRDWDNPRFVITTQYMHDAGTTVLCLDVADKCKMELFTPHFWKRFRNRYLQDDSLTLQETIDFYFRNAGFYREVQGVLDIDNDKYFIDEETEFYANVNSFGVLFCEKIKNIDKYHIYNTFISRSMLFKQQSRNVAVEYACFYFEDYKVYNPKDSARVDNDLEMLLTKADDEKWSIDKFIIEIDKLMEKYPIVWL